LLELSNFPISEAIRLLASAGVQAGFLVPTRTILEKSYFDAHSGLRRYLAATGYHDYASQESAQKERRGGLIVGASLNEPTKISMYRPNPKPGAAEGFTRIWFSGIGKHCEVGDLLAVIVTPSGLLVLNMSREENRSALADPASPLRQRVTVPAIQEDSHSQELLAKLRDIGSRGYVPTAGTGPRGVGMTLEALLGIAANSRRAPDFHGIEIKAGVVTKSGRGARKTLFAEVPDWARSAVDAMTLLTRFGRPKNGRLNLNCTLSSTMNSFNLALAMSSQPDDLLAQHAGNTGKRENLLRWGLPILEKRLEEKHAVTFWVSAEKRVTDGGILEFHYVRAMRTMKPVIANLGSLLAEGIVQVDLLMHDESRSRANASGATRRVRDHGYLFKIAQKHHDLLFPDPRSYSLID
jgi:hypothetical protein